MVAINSPLRPKWSGYMWLLAGLDGAVYNGGMRRTILGILALGLLAAAGGLYWGGLADDYTPVLSACLRLGLVLGALWLAFDQVDDFVSRTSPWMMGGALLCLLIIVVRPRAILAVGPLLAAAAALRYLGRFLKSPPD